jgi:glycine/D-amino acid oxidase-like deaminating enzyme
MQHKLPSGLLSILRLPPKGSMARKGIVTGMLGGGVLFTLAFLASDKSKTLPTATIAPPLKPYDSVEDLTSYLTEQARGSGWQMRPYAPSSLGGWNAWTTPDPTLRKFVRDHFPDIEENFALSAPTSPSASPTDTTTHIRSDSDIQKQIPGFRGSFLYSSVCSGGISALWAAYLMSALYKAGIIKHPPVYVMPEDIKHSASKGSSGQFHVSHATPMYTDPEFGALNILFQTIRRSLTDVDPRTDNYMIGEIDLSRLDARVLRVGLGYLFNEIEYKFNRYIGRPTIADKTISDAILAGFIMDNVGSELKEELLLRRNTIRVAYNLDETREMEQTREEMARHGIACRQISAEKALEYSGTTPRIGEGGSIWEVEGDGNISPKLFDTLCDAIEKNGGTVVKSGKISVILHDKDSKRTTGVVVDLGKENGIPVQEILRTDSVYTSFGCYAKYVADNGITLNTDVEPIIPATGYSGYIIVTGDSPITRPIDSNNSHFTPFATKFVDGKHHTIVKTTCGGAIGTDSLNRDHAINSLWYARNVIFPGMEVAVVSARPCSRPINTINSGRITEVLPGNHVATGFGGKGITDAPTFAAKYTMSTLAGDKTKEEYFSRRYLADRRRTIEVA